jgi:hypothetical protein
MKLEASNSSYEAYAHLKLVRTDNCVDVPGLIISADEATGEAAISLPSPVGAETKALSFGPGGFRIVRRGR